MKPAIAKSLLVPNFPREPLPRPCVSDAPTGSEDPNPPPSANFAKRSEQSDPVDGAVPSLPIPTNEVSPLLGEEWMVDHTYHTL